MAGSVIVAGARTPIGRFNGAFASLAAVDLGGAAITAALERAGISPDQVDYVFMGQVLQAGTGQITARQAAAKAGVPMTTPATTVNKVCLSGLHTIYLADQMIASGDADVVVAGGMESMTNAPYLVPGARSGLRIGDAKLVSESGDTAVVAVSYAFSATPGAGGTQCSGDSSREFTLTKGSSGWAVTGMTGQNP